MVHRLPARRARRYNRPAWWVPAVTLAALAVALLAFGVARVFVTGSRDAALAPSAPVASPVTLPAYDAAALADHPVAFWAMRAAGPTEPDLSGHGHRGTYRRGIPSTVSLPDGERAADFNGAGEHLEVPSSLTFSLAATGELTFEGWIRPTRLRFTRTNDPGHAGYVDWMGKCQNYTGDCEWEARMYSSVNSEHRCSRLSAYIFNLGAGLGSSADWQPSCRALRAHRWLYVVGEYQSRPSPDCGRAGRVYPGTINIWVNGVPWNRARHVPNGCMSLYRIRSRPGNSPLDIGTMALDTWFPGAVGDVALYDTLLSQAQISAHYHAMTGAKPSGGCRYTCAAALAPTRSNATRAGN